ncbi:MFS transporter [Streptomyces sp. NPDC006739]|uniref:MFS transporter n=1 Tax=Streptomyces sp. NPDC006739 TaxID=3364763 RepID=UPI0036976BB7
MINRDFTLVWTGQALSDLASEMTSLALPLAVLATTRSAVDAGLVATAVGVAQLAARLPSGLVADLVDRRRLMMVCDAGRALIALFLAFTLVTGRFTTTVAVVAAAATAVLSSLFSPAEGGLVRQIVPADRRRELLTRNIVRSNVAIAVGPPIGGVLLTLGAPVAFVLDAFSYLLSLALLSRVTHRGGPSGASGHSPTVRPSAVGGLRDLCVELSLGIRWVLSRRALLALIALVVYINLLGRAVELLAAVDSSDVGSHPAAAGVVLTAAGCGGIVGGMCVGWVLRRVRPSLILTWVTAEWLVVIPLTATGSKLVTLVAVFLLVLGLPLVGSLASLTVMADAPSELQGRVSTSMTLLAISIAWLGPGVTGFLISAYGAPVAALLLAAPLLLALGVLAGSPRLRALLDSLSHGDDTGPGHTGREPSPNRNRTDPPDTGEAVAATERHTIE